MVRMSQRVQPEIAAFLGKVKTFFDCVPQLKKAPQFACDTFFIINVWVLSVFNLGCAFALMWVQMNLTQADRVWRHFDQLIRVDIGNRLFQ